MGLEEFPKCDPQSAILDACQLIKSLAVAIGGDIIEVKEF